MERENQFFVFCLCLFVGFLGGLLYEFFSLLRLALGCKKDKNGILGAAIDILFFIGLAVWCVFSAFVLRLPNIRVYMIAGYGLGLLLYLIFLHRMVAFFENVCYNVLRKLIKKGKKARKNSQKEGDKHI